MTQRERVYFSIPGIGRKRERQQKDPQSAAAELMNCSEGTKKGVLQDPCPPHSRTCRGVCVCVCVCAHVHALTVVMRNVQDRRKIPSLNLKFLGFEIKRFCISLSAWSFGDTVLLYLGCYNKIPQTGRLVTNRNLFLTVGSDEDLLPGCRLQTSCRIHTWQRAERK